LPCEAVALALTVTGDSLLNGEAVGWAARPTAGGPVAHPTAFGPTLRIDLNPGVPTGLAEFTLSNFRAVVDEGGCGSWRLPEAGWVSFMNSGMGA
jgi:hypothetical protein